jgi:hypothetical protein
VEQMPDMRADAVFHVEQMVSKATGGGGAANFALETSRPDG